MTKEQLKKAIKEEIQVIRIKDERFLNKDFIALKDEKVERRSEEITSEIIKYVKLSNFDEVLLKKEQYEITKNGYVIIYDITLYNSKSFFDLSIRQVITCFEWDIHQRF